jgi:nucleoside-diphosphate-sugar epimerase
MTRILVTGAGGFVGRALMRRFGANGAQWLRLDRELDDEGPAQALRGDLTQAEVVREAAAFGPDIVFHLASAPGALAERDAALSRRVNLDASLDLFAALAATGRRPRVVYASSVAVYGEGVQGRVSRQTPAQPASTYGAHKRMVEVALDDYVRRGDLCGVSLRLPGVVARPLAAGFGSAFMSELPRAVAQGRRYVCPVSPDAVAWWMSAPCAAQTLMHATLSEASGVLLPPALRLSVNEVLDALSALYGRSRRGLVEFQPDARIEATFGRFGELDAGWERALGFVDDGDARALLSKALEDTETEESP